MAQDVSAPVAAETKSAATPTDSPATPQAKCREGQNAGCAETSVEASDAGEMFKLGCERRHAYSCARWGQWYELSRDYPRSVELYRRACGLGEKLACDWNRDLHVRLCYVEMKDEFCGKFPPVGGWVIVDLFRFPERSKVARHRALDFTQMTSEMQKAYRAALMSGHPRVADVIVEIHRGKSLTPDSARVFYRDVSYLYAPAFPGPLVNEIARLRVRRNQPHDLSQFFPAGDLTIFCDGAAGAASRPISTCRTKNCAAAVVAYFEKAQKNLEAFEVRGDAARIRDDFVNACKANIVRLQMTRYADAEAVDKKQECLEMKGLGALRSDGSTKWIDNDTF
jgi:hypothetical protein